MCFFYESFHGVSHFMGASCFNGRGGCFSDGGASFLSGGWGGGAAVLMRGFSKKIVYIIYIIYRYIILCTCVSHKRLDTITN